MAVIKKTDRPGPVLKNSAIAPVVYFDNAPVYGSFAGNIEVEIATRVLIPGADGHTILTDMVCVAHLRCSPQAAHLLADSLMKAVDMLTHQQAAQSELLKN
jgi:hypothetical protein